MHRPKPKSAPARLKSKFVKNRTNAMKEIEAWVRKDNESFAVPEASRMSGQLSDNVTEERMLKAKLWELSKERYKFLSQNTYEKKVFQDRQQRKTELRRISSASSDYRKRSGTEEELEAESRRNSLGRMTPPRVKHKNARFSLLDRLDPTKRKSSITKSLEKAKCNNEKLLSDKPDVSRGTRVDARITRVTSRTFLTNGGTEEVPVSGKVRSVQFLPTESRNGAAQSPAALSRSLSFPVSDCGEVTNSTEKSREITPGSSAKGDRHRLKTVPSVSVVDRTTHCKDAETASPAPWSAQQNKPFSQITPDDADAAASSDQPAWFSSLQQREPTKYGQKMDSLTHDPRYASLERTLCPLTRSKTTGDIQSIVSNIESLHVRPRKRPTDAPKSKIEVKAYEFMKEKGFAF